jgi:hypothetical protein
MLQISMIARAKALPATIRFRHEGDPTKNGRKSTSAVGLTSRHAAMATTVQTAWRLWSARPRPNVTTINVSGHAVTTIDGASGSATASTRRNRRLSGESIP